MLACEAVGRDTLVGGLAASTHKRPALCAPVPPFRLESHYYREQEAEFNASLHEYYAARARHQAEQQRLNQVRLGEAVCCTGDGSGHV